MAQAKALLEAAIAAKEEAQKEAVAAARKHYEEELAYATTRTEERLAQAAREAAASREADARLHRGEVERQRELAEAAAAARQRAHENELKETAALHGAQLDAYRKIETQGGALGKLNAEVHASAEALAALREKMERELWKGVLQVRVAHHPPALPTAQPSPAPHASPRHPHTSSARRR